MANAAINAALIAAAAEQQALTAKAILDPLKEAGAFTARKAITLDLSAKGTDKLLAQLVKRGHVRESGAGRYWLDREEVERSKAAAGRAGWIITAVMLSITASLIALAAAF
jgi:hypothetical protein